MGQDDPGVFRWKLGLVGLNPMPKWIREFSLDWLTVGCLLAAVMAVVLFRSHPGKATRLVVACEVGNTQAVTNILNQGVDPNSVSGTNSALIVAIRSGRIDAIRVLLARGASPTFEAGTGISPLTWGVRARDPAIVATLLEFKADPKQRNADGTTAADAAKGDPAILQILSAKTRN
jgi:ankyrin repeat protein